jgi:hypothetical protein
MNGEVKYILMEIKIKRRTKREGSRRTKNSSRKIIKFLFRICKAFFMGLDILREMLEDDVRRQSEIMSILTVDRT